LIGGSPSDPGVATMGVVASNATGNSAPLTLRLAIAAVAGAPVVISTRTVSSQIGTAFSYPIVTNPVATSFAANGLPPGLALNATTGVIAGTPAASGVFEVVITVRNASGVGIPITVVLTIRPNVTLVVPGS
jgi:hypothetical protein